MCVCISLLIVLSRTCSPADLHMCEHLFTRLSTVGVSELFTRLQFVMYAAAILGLAATLLKPYIADTGVLSYVGLDRIARKLLSVTPTQQP